MKDFFCDNRFRKTIKFVGAFYHATLNSYPAFKN